MTKEEARACLDKGIKYIDEGQTQLAWSEFSKVEMGMFDPSINAEAIVGEGVVYIAEGNFRAAIDKFRYALEKDPHNPNALAFMQKAQQAYYNR